MYVSFNRYGFKLFILAIIIFLFLKFFMHNYNFSYINGNNFILILTFDIILSIASLFFLEDMDIIGYYLVWYWASLLYFLSPHIMPDVFTIAFNNPLWYLFFIPIIYSIVFGTAMLIIRKIFYAIKKSKWTSIYSENRISAGKQNIRYSIFYSVLIYFDIYIYNASEYKFLEPHIFIVILAIAYILSFISLNFNRVGYNLSIFIIFAISLLPIIKYHYTGNINNLIILITILIISSTLLYILTFHEEIDIYTHNTTGNVVGSRLSGTPSYFILLIVWVITNIFLRTLSINTRTILFILLPIAIGSIISDTIHGKSAASHSLSSDSVSVVGGVGMADGLWAPLIFFILIYLLLLNHYLPIS